MTEADRDAGDPTVAHQRIGAAADHCERDCLRESREKGGEIVAVRGLEQYVGDTAGAKPGMPADRCVRCQFAARRWQG